MEERERAKEQKTADELAAMIREVLRHMDGCPKQGIIDARNKRVYPPLPHPRPAEGLPSHSLLWTSGQVFLRGKSCTSPRTARRTKTASPD